MSRRRPRGPTRRDAGSVLVLSLVLTVVMGLVAIGLANYVSTALRTSRVTDQRTAGAARAAAAITWNVEELTTKRSSPCATTTTVTVPAEVAGSDTTLVCRPSALLDGHPTVVLTSTATLSSGAHVVIDARVQVPTMSYEAFIVTWNTSVV